MKDRVPALFLHVLAVYLFALLQCFAELQAQVSEQREVAGGESCDELVPDLFVHVLQHLLVAVQLYLVLRHLNRRRSFGCSFMHLMLLSVLRVKQRELVLIVAHHSTSAGNAVVTLTVTALCANEHIAELSYRLSLQLLKLHQLKLRLLPISLDLVDKEGSTSEQLLLFFS